MILGDPPLAVESDSLAITGFGASSKREGSREVV
jgi:hypothetical protein